MFKMTAKNMTAMRKAAGYGRSYLARLGERMDIDTGATDFQCYGMKEHDLFDNCGKLSGYKGRTFLESKGKVCFDLWFYDRNDYLEDSVFVFGVRTGPGVNDWLFQADREPDQAAVLMAAVERAAS